MSDIINVAITDADGEITTGTIDAIVFGAFCPSHCIGKQVTITAKDENGNPVLVTGILAEVFD